MTCFWIITSTDSNFFEMMLHGGEWNGHRILSRACVAVMTENHTGTLKAGRRPGMGYGLGWAVVRDPLGTLPLTSIGSFEQAGLFGNIGLGDSAKDLVGIFVIQRTSGGGGAELNVAHQERQAEYAWRLPSRLIQAHHASAQNIPRISFSVSVLPGFRRRPISFSPACLEFDRRRSPRQDYESS